MRCIETALARFGGFHGLYHVAGGSGRRFGDGPLDQITESRLGAHEQENLTSLFLSNRAAVRQFLSQGGGGSVLNMSFRPRFFAVRQAFQHARLSAAKAARDWPDEIRRARYGQRRHSV